MRPAAAPVMVHAMSMRRFLAGLTVLGSVAASLVIATSAAQADTVICEKWGTTTIQGGKYVVQNNNWGSDIQQCITVTATGFTVSQANHNKPTNGAPGAYPSVFAGCHYGTCSSGSRLPMRATDSLFDTIRTSVRMTYPSSGVYNASYDLWFDPTPRTDGQNTGAEIMVWLNRVGSIQPIGSRVDTVNLAGATWEVWYGNTGWNVISYVRTTPVDSISFAVREFFDDAVRRGYAQRSWYLTSVQAGFEPWVGGTGLTVNEFSYSVGGSDPTEPSPPVTTSPPASPPPGGAACRVAYRKNEWPGGFTADVTVTNTGSSAINGWNLTFTFPSGQRVTNGWNATISQSGATVTAQNMSYNASIPPGGSVSFGFQGTWTGSNGDPADFTLNGTRCQTA